jgi:hypothetical protein
MSAETPWVEEARLLDHLRRIEAHLASLAHGRAEWLVLQDIAFQVREAIAPATWERETQAQPAVNAADLAAKKEGA